jgi:hypothetical protein
MDNKRIHLNSGLTKLESRLGLPVERTHSGTPARDRWLTKMFPNGVNEVQTLYQLEKRFMNDAINAMARIHVTKAKNAKIAACRDAKQAVD